MEQEMANYQERDKSVVIYRSKDGTIQLDVQLYNDTVWLTQAQIAELFNKDISVISRHIKNIYKEGELDEESNLHFLQIPFSDKPVRLYDLDMIIAVGYRVKSSQGTQFRKWARPIIKDYILKGYAINQRFERLESRVSKTEEKIDFFVKTSLPPIQGIFCDGQIFDAYVFVSELIKRAKSEIILIDNYIDESVLTVLDKRNENVAATIYTAKISEKLKLDLQKHNCQYRPITIKHSNKSHDRFLIIDEEVYHIGASLKDLGKRMFAFTRLGFSRDEIIEKM